MSRKLLLVGSTLPTPDLVGRLHVANVTEMHIAMQEEVQLVLPLSAEEMPSPDLDRPSGPPPSCAAMQSTVFLQQQTVLHMLKNVTSLQAYDSSSCSHAKPLPLDPLVSVACGYILPHSTVMRYRAVFFTINSGALVVIPQSSISLCRFSCFGLKRHHLASWILS